MVITCDTDLSEILNTSEVKGILDDASGGIDGIVYARIGCLEDAIGGSLSATKLGGNAVISNKGSNIVSSFYDFSESMHNTFDSIAELTWNKELEELQELEKKIKEKIEELEEEIKSKRREYEALSDEEKETRFYSFASEVRELRQKIIDYETKLMQVIARENGSTVVAGSSINTDINQDLTADEIAQYSSPSPLDPRNWAPSYMGGNQGASPARAQAEQGETPYDPNNWAPSYMGGNQPGAAASASASAAAAAAAGNGFSGDTPVTGGGGSTDGGVGVGRSFTDKYSAYDCIGSGYKYGADEARKYLSDLGYSSSEIEKAIEMARDNGRIDITKSNTGSYDGDSDRTSKTPSSTPTPTPDSTPSPTPTPTPDSTSSPTPTPSPTPSPSSEDTRSFNEKYSAYDNIGKGYKYGADEARKYLSELGYSKSEIEKAIEMARDNGRIDTTKPNTGRYSSSASAVDNTTSNGFSGDTPVTGGGGTTDGGSGVGRSSVNKNSSAAAVAGASIAAATTTATSTATPTPTPTATPTPTPTATPTPTPTATPTPTPTATPTPTPTATPTPTPTATPTATPQNEQTRQQYIDNALKIGKEIADDDTHGYSMSNRNGDPDYDCSSYVIDVYEQAGIPVRSEGGASDTSNMKAAFEKVGFEWIPGNPNTTGIELQPGDVLLKQRSGKKAGHAEIYYGDGLNLGAHTNKDKKPGDSSGREINLSASLGNHAWQGILRYKENA